MKRIFVSVFIMMNSLLLTGCSGEEHSGNFYSWFVEPLDKLLKYLYDLTGIWWVAILLITILVRTIILPFALKTTKNQNLMSVGMNKVKPETEEIQLEIKKLQEKIKYTRNSSEVDKLKIKLQQKQNEIMSIYRKHGINPLGSVVGCLPMLLTMPVLSGLFFALKFPVHSASISDATFLTLNLGRPSLILTLIAGFIYFLQAHISLMNTSTDQREQMKLMSYMSPIFIILFSYTSAGALALYWIFGGIYMIVQTFLSKKLYPSLVSVSDEKVVKQGFKKEASVSTLNINKSKIVSRKKKQ